MQFAVLRSTCPYRAPKWHWNSKKVGFKIVPIIKSSGSNILSSSKVAAKQSSERLLSGGGRATCGARPAASRYAIGARPRARIHRTRVMSPVPSPVLVKCLWTNYGGNGSVSVRIRHPSPLSKRSRRTAWNRPDGHRSRRLHRRLGKLLAASSTVMLLHRKLCDRNVDMRSSHGPMRRLAEVCPRTLQS